MSRKSFEGDESNKLPRRMIEPYRLWFEYLKAALSDPKVTVNHSIYETWGNVRDADFDEWWEDHWRRLFAEPASDVSVVRSADEATSVLQDHAYVLVRVPLNSLSKVRTAGLEKIVKSELRQRPRGKIGRSQAPFQITAKRIIRRDVLRGMLRLYQMFLKNHRDLDATAVEYHEWAIRWNAEVRSKGWDRPTVYVPPSLAVYVAAIKELEVASTPAQKRAIRKLSHYDSQRPKIKRYVLRAQRIANNVGKGLFPGEFE
ncbi:MAG: hypothetical protein JNL45_11045 [Hyphomicrobium sp.]|nr:hypothetical protein [Hyphomicrobium sp.]